MTHGEVAGPELLVRKAVLQRLLCGAAVDLAALGASAGLRPDEVAQVLSTLSELEAIHVMDGLLVAAYPLSGVPTRHRVCRSETVIYANCALDALAVPFMVDEIVSIESNCAQFVKKRSRCG